MSHVLAQVSFLRSSGLPQDRVVNTFHFDRDPAVATATANAAIQTAIKNFYDTAPAAGGAPLRSYMSSILAQNGHTTKIYDMTDPEPRVPQLEVTWGFTAAMQSTNVVPAEVALCLSFRGALISGTNPAHRRGRIFLGPIAPSLTVANGDARPASTMTTALAEKGKDLINDADTVWCVWSETGQTLVPVNTVWVDDSFDTQRRRGAVPTTRVTRP